MARKHVKAFQAMCFDNVHRGLINHADGSWKESRVDKQMDLDMQAGYRLSGRLKRAKKQKQSAA